MSRGIRRAIATAGLLTAAVALSAPVAPPLPSPSAPVAGRLGVPSSRDSAAVWKPLRRPPGKGGARPAVGPRVTAGHTPQHNVSISVRVRSVPVDPEATPSYSFSIAQNFPNPFAGSTTIRYTLARATRCQIVIFSVTGQRVATLVNDVLGPGEYSMLWNGTNDRGARLHSGLYLYRITAGPFVRSRKLILE